MSRNDSARSSPTPVSPAECETAPRHGLPQLSAEWAAAGWDADDLPVEVEVCGDYEVTATLDGWLGWFQAEEPGQTPN